MGARLEPGRSRLHSIRFGFDDIEEFETGGLGPSFVGRGAGKGGSKAGPKRKVPNPHGRLGKPSTRRLNKQVAADYEAQGYTTTGGGGKLPEEYIRSPNGLQGGTFVDNTFTKGPATVRVQTVDTRADGVTPTTKEINAANRIMTERPGDGLVLISKLRKQVLPP